MLLNTITGCRRSPRNTVAGSQCVLADFKPLLNFDSAAVKGVVTFQLQFSDVTKGIRIPDESGAPAEIEYSFKIKNTGSKAERFAYKLYYYNESYRFPEIRSKDSSRQHPYASENFYGSWENKEGVRYTALIPPDGRFHEIRGSYVITGNPRDEKRYMTAHDSGRWKRNPRMGKYSFLLVASPDGEAENAAFPEFMSDLSRKTDSSFITPYFYFLYGKGSKDGRFVCMTSADTLNVLARLPLENGVCTDTNVFNPKEYNSYFCKSCGMSPQLKKKALFTQFIHYIDTSSYFNNIAVLADVAGDEYNLSDYYWNSVFLNRDEYVRTLPAVLRLPCENAITDTLKKSIRIVNLAADRDHLQKQNTGIITRLGLTYGTYTVKVKLQKLLNKYGIWNGLTNAIWLISQSQDRWNARRPCTAEGGYITNYYGGKQRDPLSSYSEIDFEILKTSYYCPEYKYAQRPLQPVADRRHRAMWDLPYPGGESEKDKIMICCTNWDMACPSPENYGAGCQDVNYESQHYTAMRWDHWYKAITAKTEASDAELFGGSYYYFRIIWRPEEIIWEVGPGKDKMRVVCYMNSSMTEIPNNQMLLVISQEFHNSQWWPGSPFNQSYIPFPSKDLSGEVFEVTIE
jgi:hypothetical protein